MLNIIAQLAPTLLPPVEFGPISSALDFCAKPQQSEHELARAIVPLIMCGGAGTRLWPASRENRPKQFLPLFGPLARRERTAGIFLKLRPSVNRASRGPRKDPSASRYGY